MSGGCAVLMISRERILIYGRGWKLRSELGNRRPLRMKHDCENDPFHLFAWLTIFAIVLVGKYHLIKMKTSLEITVCQSQLIVLPVSLTIHVSGRMLIYQAISVTLGRKKKQN